MNAGRQSSDIAMAIGIVENSPGARGLAWIAVDSYAQSMAEFGSAFAGCVADSARMRNLRGIGRREMELLATDHGKLHGSSVSLSRLYGLGRISGRNWAQA